MNRTCVFLLTAATGPGIAPAAPQLKEQPQEQLFFPVSQGATWVYRIGGGDVTYAVTAVEKRADGTFVRVGRIPPTGKDVAVMAVLVNKKGVFLLEEVGQAYDPPWCIFKVPAAPGEKWDTETSRVGLGKMTDTRTPGKPEVLDLAAGKVTAIPVVVTARSYDGGPEGARTRTYWWAAGIGWAKIQDGGRTIRELKSFTPAVKK